MRGKAFRYILRDVDSGITPAYAGKSCGHQCRQYMPQDHPRVCGEKDFSAQHPERGRGSPPRMRGKVCGLHAPTLVGRITPAYAGKSLDRLSAPEFTWDHPRVCGEKKCPLGS